MIAVAGPLAGQSGFGLVGGFVSSNATIDPPTAGVTWSARSGFAGGISLTAKVSHDFEIGPEVMYVTKGINGTGAVGAATATITEKIGYAEGTLMLRYLFGLTGNAHLSLMAGPAVSMKLSCTQDQTGIPGEPASKDCNDPADPTSGIKSTDYGVMFGAGLHLSRISFSGRYEIGLVNIARNTGTGASTAKNKTFFALVGIALGK